MSEINCPTCGKALPDAEAACPDCDATFVAPAEEAAPEEEAKKEDIQLGELRERYDFVKELGAGAMGSVILARDRRLDREVAVKRILNQEEQNQEMVQRFLREARAMAMFQHPNIVRVIDVGEDELGAYIIMDFIEGGSLESLLRKEGRFTLARALNVARQLLGALCALAEKDVVHRDIKPLNLIMQKTPEGGERPVLVDFGLARDPGDTSLTQVGDALGTLHYMAPEQWTDSSNVDHRADLYAVGATMYRMLTGKAPAEILRDEIPAEARALTMKLLERARDMRPQSATEALQELLQIECEGVAQVQAMPAAAPAAPDGAAAENVGPHLSDASASIHRSANVPLDACASCGGALPADVLECSACQDGRNYCSEPCFMKHVGEEHCAACSTPLVSRYIYSAEMNQKLGHDLRFCTSDCRKTFEQAQLCSACRNPLPEEFWHAADITAQVGYEARFCSSNCVESFRGERMCSICGRGLPQQYLTCGACPEGKGFCGEACFSRHVAEAHS